VGKIIGDLHFNEIPQLIVLNKADLLETADVDRLIKQISLDSNAQCVSISAIHRETLRPMIDIIGKLLAMPEPEYWVHGSTV